MLRSLAGSMGASSVQSTVIAYARQLEESVGFAGDIRGAFGREWL